MKKIVILGPESTGKSFLCKQLADHYQSQWVPEFAREYLETNGATYQFEDLYKIALGQIKGEDLAASNVSSLNPLPSTLHPVFLDTDLYTLKIWSEISFDRCDNRILSQIATRQYDAYLLCNPDLPWMPDPLREYPDLAMRQKIYHYYRDALVNQAMPWVDISGTYDKRFEMAINFVDRIASA